MLEPVFTLREGARMYAPGGKLLQTGEMLRQPGLVRALELVATEGAGSAYSGAIAASLLDLSGERGGLLTADDLRAYEAVWSEPAETPWLGLRLLSRGGLSGVADTVPRLPRLRELSPAARVVAGLDLHLNSMLGETDLLLGPLEPGGRMASMMAPSVVLDDVGLVLALGAAGGTRLRSALVAVAAGILDEGLEPQDAVDRGRVHPAGELVNAEPGVDEDGLALLEAAGRPVRRWPERHHYFGGVSLLGRAGAAADPRRSGAVRIPAAG
jgi:gamma-glutamyltranspeptidase/glutathione hydrolase